MHSLAKPAHAETTLQDPLKVGGLGPVMIIIKPGSYIMGSAPDEPGRFPSEGPTHRVHIEYSFAVSRYEVKFSEYDRFSDATGHGRPSDQGWGDSFWGRGNMPVFNVSWQDAVDYTRWLSQQTGKKYRLLSEAEWEYAARAGNVAAFTSGRCISKDVANFHAGYAYSDCPVTGLYRGKMILVGQFSANPWGLYDVHGNAFEWIADCWHANYNGAPSNGTAWLNGTTKDEFDLDDTSPAECNNRVLRGGSWSGRPRDIRFAQRAKNNVSFSSIFIGFRIARDL